jgi:hypothetical protein
VTWQWFANESCKSLDDASPSDPVSKIEHCAAPDSVARLAAGVIALLSVGCKGVIEDAGYLPVREGATAGASALPTSPGVPVGQVDPNATTPPGTATGTQPPGGAATPTRPNQGNGLMTPGSLGQPAMQDPGANAGAAAPGGGTVPPGSTAPNWDPGAVNGQGESVGVGDISMPALGPAPTFADKVPGEPFVLVKNWNFGADGTIVQMSDLIAEFDFHDQFGTIANGTNYGCVTVAPTAETAITVRDLGLPNNRQPVEDPARPYREFMDDAIRTHVRPLSASATSITATRHDSGNGSFMSKWSLPKGGERLGKDLLWESRVRINKPAKAFWFALWTAGHKWNKGAEMDVVESFGTPNIGAGARAFHVNSVGGRDKYPYSSWSNELNGLGVPTAERDLSEWHTFTWVYLRDDSYQVFFDDHLVQEGTLIWTLGATPSGEELDMQFLFDFSWGHTQVQEVNISLPVSELEMTYELDYSRVYLRD